MAGEADVVLFQAQPAALGNRDLFLDEVQAADCLRDGVLDLDACVHFQEIERVTVTVYEQFHGAQASVLQVSGKGDCCAVHLFAERFTKIGRGSFFDKLLVAPLDRTVASAEMDYVFAVAEHLDFDMAAVRDVALQVHTRIAEAACASVTANSSFRQEPTSFVYLLDATTATATCGLDQDRPADLTRQSPRFVEVADLAAGDAGQPETALRAPAL